MYSSKTQVIRRSSGGGNAGFTFVTLCAAVFDDQHSPPPQSSFSLLLGVAHLHKRLPLQLNMHFVTSLLTLNFVISGRKKTRTAAGGHHPKPTQLYPLYVLLLPPHS